MFDWAKLQKLLLEKLSKNNNSPILDLRFSVGVMMGVGSVVDVGVGGNQTIVTVGGMVEVGGIGVSGSRGGEGVVQPNMSRLKLKQANHKASIFIN